ncbi:MAG: hypothetical protein J2O48_01605 [Solirubrobacterales bacterium]|nr:hypothetical protein [Solirubrobacterales bacterium]
MPRVALSRDAMDDLRTLIRAYGLPDTTVARVKAATEALERFPSLGQRLRGRGEGRRGISGPWPWMLISYVWLEDADLIAILRIEDVRTAEAPSGH